MNYTPVQSYPSSVGFKLIKHSLSFSEAVDIIAENSTCVLTCDVAAYNGHLFIKTLPVPLTPYEQSLIPVELEKRISKPVLYNTGGFANIFNGVVTFFTINEFLAFGKSIDDSVNSLNLWCIYQM